MLGQLLLTLLADDAADRSRWLQAIIDLWPVLTAIGGGIVAIVGLLIGIRYLEKAKIGETNEKNVEALRKLLETRDLENADLVEDKKHLEREVSELRANFDTVESEYKAVAGIILSELLTWVAERRDHQAQLALKDSRINVLERRIELMEKREADQADAIHKSKP